MATKLTEEGRRHGVDLNFARIEDAIHVLSKDAPLLPAESEWVRAIIRDLARVAGLESELGQGF